MLQPAGRGESLGKALMRRTWWLAAGLALLAARGAAQTDYFSPGSVRRFADYLYSEQQFARAAGEYQRYLLIADSAQGRDTIEFRIAQCLRRAKQQEQALVHYERAAGSNPDAEWRDRLAYEVAFSWLEVGKPAQSIASAQSHTPAVPGYRGRFRNLTALNYLYLKQWGAAQAALRGDATQGDTIAQQLETFALEGIRLPRRSPALAGVMSAVIPGAGKAYAGRIPDALFSLATIGLTGWQAYEGFRRDSLKSVSGWIYGTLAVGLYVGDIWGSVVAALQHNERAEDALLSRIGDLRVKLEPAQ